MLEFSSISVSSYDAASLAGKLTEKSGEGWDVVAIVAAGTNVTAYLSRSSSGSGDAGASSTGGADLFATATAADTSSDTSGDTGAADVAVDEAPTPEPAPSYEPVLPSAATEVTPSPVEEPAGWASEPEPQPATTSSWTTETTSVAPQPEPVVAVTPEPEPEPVQAAASAAAAPAGWYADPSGRFELRYWDGSQWTEHVSRAGQQYTDPPVA